MNVIKLTAGQRFSLTGEQRFARIVSGAAEVYAVTSGERDAPSFRQMFLAELERGGAAFPSLDEFGQIDILLYAKEDTEIELPLFSKTPPGALRTLMRDWFSRIAALPCFRLLADKGDDVIGRWADGDPLADAGMDYAAVMEGFTENEAILSMLIGVQFGAEDRRLSLRAARRAHHQRRVVREAVGHLLGEELLLPGGEDGGREETEEAEYIVRRIAAALGQSPGSLRIAPEMAKKMNRTGLLRRLAQKCNMQMRRVTLTADWYEKDCGVLLGCYGAEKDLAALLPTRPGAYVMATRKRPEGVPVTAEIAAGLDADAFVCYAGFPARKLETADLLRFMLKSCWKTDYRTLFLASLIAGLIPLVTPIVTETVFADILPILDRRGLATVTQVFMVTGFTLAAVSAARAVAVMRIATHIDMAAEAALWGRLLTLPTKFFRAFPSGELAGRMGGIDAVKTVVNGEFVSGVFNVVFSVWSLLLMCWYSLKLTAAALLVWLVFCGAQAFVCRRVIGFQKNLIDAKNKTAGLVQQMFAGLAKFRVQGAEAQAYLLWSRAFGEEWRWKYKLRWQENYMAMLGSVQPFILTLVLYALVFQDVSAAARQNASAAVGYAEFLAFQAAFTGFNATLTSLIPLFGRFFAIRPHIENLRPILEAEPEVLEDKIDADVLTGAVEAHHLAFSYREDGPDVLSDLTFRVAAGEHVAIVGRSGCGKSTLIRLLLGFETPKRGAVYYDGQDLAELALPSVRSQMGVVLQNGQLMAGDIFTNIAGVGSSFTQDDAWRAAEAAGVADDIRRMPMGMQTIVSEGSSNISGGQRQRILIARALAANPAIIIFDEATSALDNRTQAIVTESLQKLRATRIVVAHRLSTIREADRILVMDQGKIVESGTFDELSARGGLFSLLVRRQTA